MKKLVWATMATLAVTAGSVMAAEKSKDHGKAEFKAPIAGTAETTGSGAAGNNMKAGGPPPTDSSNTIKYDNGPKSGEPADRSGSLAVHPSKEAR